MIKVNVTSKNINEKNRVRWYVMRAYKCEGKAEEKLKGEDGLDYYIPKKYTVQVYHGKKTRRLVPVIPNLIFVHASHSQIIEFKQKCNFLQFMMWKMSTGLEYLTVPDNQMSNFIKISSQYDEDLKYYKPEEIDFKKGTRVRIHGGQFDGLEGTFIKLKGTRSKQVVVKLDNIMAVSAQIHLDLIEVINEKSGKKTEETK